LNQLPFESITARVKFGSEIAVECDGEPTTTN
jgi:hypothetical protein